MSSEEPQQEQAATPTAEATTPSRTHEDMILDVITVEEGQTIRIHEVTEVCYRVNVWAVDRSGVCSTNSIVRSYFIAIRDGIAVIKH